VLRGGVGLQDADHLAICPECNFTFCSLCNDAWHPGAVCLDAAGKLRVLEQRCACPTFVSAPWIENRLSAGEKNQIPGNGVVR